MHVKVYRVPNICSTYTGTALLLIFSALSGESVIAFH